MLDKDIESGGLGRAEGDERRLFEALLDQGAPDLVERLAEIVYQRYYKLVHYFLRIFDIPIDDQPDLFNQIFMKIIRGLGQIKHCRNLKSWVVTIAKNEIFNFHQKRRREVHLYCAVDDTVMLVPLSESLEDPLLPPEKEMFNSELRTAFHEGLSMLGVELREPFILRYREGMKWREISKLLGINVDTARKRSERGRMKVLSHVKRKLRNHLLLR